MNQDTLTGLVDKTEKIEAKVNEAFHLSEILRRDYFCSKTVGKNEEKQRILNDYEQAYSLFNLLFESLKQSRCNTKDMDKVLCSYCMRR